MGIDITNVYAIAHRPDGATVTTWALRVHQANIALDATTPSEAGPTAWASITGGATQGQSAFDTAVAAVWPIWYGQRTTAQKAAIRACVQSL
jgi:hypothetical protein